MADEQRPNKRAKHDFRSTFDVLVGQQPGRVERFTLYTDIFAQRSRFLAAARKPEWLAGDPLKPVDLSDEDPEVFQAYLNFVYIGPGTLEVTSETFELEVRDSTKGFPAFWVYNVCKKVTKEELVKHFEEYGEIKECSIRDINQPHRKEESPRVARRAHFSFATAEAGGKALKARDGFVLHGHRLRLQADHDCPEAEDENHTRRYQLADLHFETLIRLYLLADKLQDRATANTIIDKIEKLFDITASCHPGNRPISIAYESTTEGSPLRRLLCNLWFYNANGDCSKRLQECQYPQDFLNDMTKQYMRIAYEASDISNFSYVERNDSFLQDPAWKIPIGCRYHQHDDEHPFCSTSTKKGEENCKSCKVGSKR